MSRGQEESENAILTHQRNYLAVSKNQRGIQAKEMLLTVQCYNR
jgi:hypothetical protein